MAPICCDYQNKIRPTQAGDSDTPRHGVVVGFSRLTETALLALKQELDLSMTVGELQFCQTEYEKGMKHPPSVDELYFLDGIARGKHHSPDFARILKCMFRDPEVARAYGDLIQKADLVGAIDKAHPPTFPALFSVLSSVLKRSGKEASLSDVIFASDPNDDAMLTAMGLSKTATLSVADPLPPLHIYRQSPDTADLLSAMAVTGDALMLLSTTPIPKPPQAVTPSPADPGSSEEVSEALFAEAPAVVEETAPPFLERLAAFASTDLYKDTVRAVRVVNETGIAVALSEIANGVYAELPRIPAVFDEGELYDLSLAEIGGIIVAIPQDTVHDFCVKARQCDILVSQIARAVSGTHFTVRREGHSPYLFPVSFLKRFSALRVPFVLKENTSREAPQILHSISANDSAEARRSTVIDHRVYTVAGVQSPDFHSALDATLTAVFSAVLHGAKCSEITVWEAFDYATEVSSETLGQLLAAFLGIYRVLAEIAIPSYGAIRPRTENSVLGCAVYASAPFDTGNAVRDTLSEEGSSVYFLKVNRAEGGIPSFSDVRRMLKLFESLSSNGEIRSVRIASDTSPYEIIQKMTDKYEVELRSGVSVEKLKNQVSEVFLILETAHEINGINRIGTTRSSLTAEAEASEQAL